MTRILILTIMLVVAIVSYAQQQLQINYSYRFNKQTYEYIEKLHAAEGTIVLDKATSTITIQGVNYKIQSKDIDKQTDSLKNVQYTVTDGNNAEYVICFQENYTLPSALKYQVVFFSANNPYDWTYYITKTGLKE